MQAWGANHCSLGPVPDRARSLAGLTASSLAALAVVSVVAMLRAPANLNWRQPLVASPPELRPAGKPRRRVLLVVLDGLRWDTARTLPLLQELAAKGASADLWADPPTFSCAQYVALLTGVTPRDSGRRTNADVGPVALESVPSRVRAAGGRTVVISDAVSWWRELFGDAFSESTVIRPTALISEARRRLAGADFAVIHLGAADEAGHRIGAASPEYRAAAEAMQETVRALLPVWGWPDSGLVVLADHGHTDRGGHGGDEPEVRKTWLVASGRGFASGARLLPARTVDVAPTLAAVLGVGPLVRSEGQTLAAALDTGDDAGFAQAGPDDAPSEVSAGADVVRRSLARREYSWIVFRLVLTLAVVGLGVLAMRIRPRDGVRGLVAGFGALALTVVGYFAVLRHASFSADREMGFILSKTMLISTGGLIAAAALPWRTALRQKADSVSRCCLLVGVAVGAAPLAAVMFVVAGAFAPRLECEPAWFAIAPMLAYAGFVQPATACAALALKAWLDTR